MHLTRAPWVVALTLFTQASPAAAQGVPDGLEPHGFVEPCTIANAQEMNTECELCEVRPGAPRCGDELSAQGYEKKCRTHGDATTFNEVWCIDRERQAKQPQGTATTSTAGARQESPSKLPLILGAPLLLGVLLVLKRALSKRGETAAK